VITEHCDIVIEKDYYQICYDYSLKGALFVSYTLQGSQVDSMNIEDRPSFYTETTLPSHYASTYSDYTGSGYDRGHLANDASFDWSSAALYSTYSMANIIPQEPTVNKYAWIDTENLEREKAQVYSSVEVIIGVVYADNPMRIGSNNIAVPTGFYKSIYNASQGYHECYYYENLPITDLAADTLDDHKVSCTTLTLAYEGFITPVIVETPTESEPDTSPSCNTSKTCTQMSSCAEAYFYLDTCGLTRLDRDSDGVPCESICN